MRMLSKAEELVLLSVWRLQDNAYGVSIRKNIIKNTGTDWSIGAIYDALERLTEWGYLETYQSDPTPERGGRSKRFFKLTREGADVLSRARMVQEKMWLDLPDPGFDLNLKR